ncbi:MAG: hypothetical protein OEY97_06880 [Nitrospirota bacterium]|nr:hypothetical protein [Nitrospirota bacterium]
MARDRTTAHEPSALPALTAGSAALLLGALVYLSARAPGSSPAALGWLPPLSSFWTPLLGQFPSLLHAFAFTLLTTVLLGTRRVIFSALLWAGIDAAFEIAQHPVIGGVGGTFDPLDLLAIATGAGLAILFLTRSPQEGAQ